MRSAKAKGGAVVLGVEPEAEVVQGHLGGEAGAHAGEGVGALVLQPEGFQDDFTDTEAVAAIVRITGGNFRLIQRLFTQIERLLQINAMRTVTKEVVEAARESMVIGPL